MVSVTMNEVIDFTNANNFLGDVDLPLKVAYKLNKMKTAIAKESEFYSNKFQEIVDKYAKKDEEGNIVFNEDGSQIMIIEDKIDDCNKELEELQTLTIDIDNQNLTIDDFGDDITCTSEELEVLMPFLS